MKVSSLPKIELHLHLDCSLSFEVVQKIDPSITNKMYADSFIAPPKCTDLADYISRAVKGIDLMQTPEQLRWVTLDLFKQLQSDHVIYAELRFAPLQHLNKGLTAKEVVCIVEEATSEGIQNSGVEARLILCTLRHYTEAQSMQTVKLVEAFKDTLVAGFDIAADEAGFPIDEHVSAFSYAREKGLHITAHAGEARGADSMWETLEHFQPTRIGHGVRCVEDPKLMDYLKQEKIHLEVCPTSNVQTNAVTDMDSHPADQIYQHGISMSISTDGRALSDVTLDKEYQTLIQQFDWQQKHFLKCNLEAVEHAFIPETEKRRLRRRLLEAY
jgi:adenosine deaminase